MGRVEFQDALQTGKGGDLTLRGEGWSVLQMDRSQRWQGMSHKGTTRVPELHTGAKMVPLHPVSPEACADLIEITRALGIFFPSPLEHIPWPF